MSPEAIAKLRDRLANASPGDRMYERPMTWGEAEALLAALASAESRATKAEKWKDSVAQQATLQRNEALAARDAALARATEAEKALREIAQQRLHAEITDSDPDELDWLGGYEECVRVARSVLSRIAKENTANG